MATVPDSVFDGLLEVIQQQKIMLQKIAEDLEAIESIGGGGGTASIEDYESGKNYKRNVLLVDSHALDRAFSGIGLIENHILAVAHLDGIYTWFRDILKPKGNVVAEELLLQIITVCLASL